MRQARARDEDCARRDLSARASSFLAVWGAPLLVGVAASFMSPSRAWTAGAWSLALAWMGAACLINARRCGRVHCYISGPILLIGATLSGAIAIAVLDPGRNGLTLIVMATLALAALSCGLEFIWGRYRRST